MPPSHDYMVEAVRQRVFMKQELVFGTMSNYVQYFAEVGGFDALFSLLSMGCTTPEGSVVDIAKVESATSAKSGASGSTPEQAKLPFKMLSYLTQAFTHLDMTFTAEFSKVFTTAVKQQIMARLETMTERDLKDVDKDEIASLIS